MLKFFVSHRVLLLLYFLREIFRPLQHFIYDMQNNCAILHLYATSFTHTCRQKCYYVLAIKFFNLTKTTSLQTRRLSVDPMPLDVAVYVASVSVKPYIVVDVLRV